MFEQTKQKMCQAIREQRKIVYTYNKPNLVNGEREGDPHIVYVTKNGHWMVDIWKTGGLITDYTKEFPGWSYYHLSYINILRLGDNFICHYKFDPRAPKFVNAKIICSVKL